MKRIVVALGGNAIEAGDNSAAAQEKQIKKTMKVVAKMIENGDQVAIVHGNGPQLVICFCNNTKVQVKIIPLCRLIQ